MEVELPEVLEFDEVANPARRIFVADGRTEGRNSPNGKYIEDYRIQENLVTLLNLKDLKNLRLVNRFCNAWIINSSDFPNKIEGNLRNTWHQKFRGMNVENTVAWRQLKMKHFVYYRNSILFRNYWRNYITKNLNTLSISRSNFECDGLAYILNGCPNLETLSLHSVRLRDIRNLHCILPSQPVNPNHAVNVRMTQIRRMQRSLKHLSLENMYCISSCAMRYLIDRSGYLESFSMVKCFHADTKLKNNAAQCKTAYEEFAVHLLRLLNRCVRANTLRKLIFKENEYQSELFEKIGLCSDDYQIGDLTVALGPNEELASLAALTKSFGFSKLERLNLELYGPFNNEDLTNVITPSVKTLKSLKLSFFGDKPSDIIQLEELVGEMAVLESIYISDKNIVKAWNTNMSRSYNAADSAPTGSNDNAALIMQLCTKLSLNYLLSLKNTLKTFSVNSVFTPLNLVSFLKRNPESFHGLTKLEIRGPPFYSLDDLLPEVVSHMLNLQCLILSNCFLHDTNTTGLSPNAVRELRKSGTYLMITCSPVDCTSGSDFLLAMRETPNPDKTERFLLSDLPDLRYVDLSLNHGITDITVFESLNIPKLTYLNLDGCNKITEASLEFISQFHKDLNELHLVNCRRITNYGMNQVIRRCPKLRRLYTTKTLRDRTIEIFDYKLSPDFVDIVRCSESESESEDSEYESD